MESGLESPNPEHQVDTPLKSLSSKNFSSKLTFHITSYPLLPSHPSTLPQSPPHYPPTSPHLSSPHQMWNLLNLSWGLLLYSGTIASALTTTHSCVTTKKVAGLNKPMQYNYLGSSDLLVSRVTLGTMTFGNQNTMQEGVAQMNRAFDHYGINAIDTAEMYPVPPIPETKFRTDECVRQFLQTRDRKDVILMTKIAGTSSRIDWLRDDFAGSKLAKLTKEQIAYSIDASLKRLDVAYIDLIQLHWPDRYVGDMFGGVDYLKSKETTDVDVSFEEQLAALNDAVKAGKVRYVGLSNEVSD